MTSPLVRVRVTTALTGEETTAVLALADAAARSDGAYPLSEHVVLHLRHGNGDSLHVLAERRGTQSLLGYSHLDVSDAAEGPAAELAVSAGSRRRGVGGMLLDEVIRQATAYPGPLRLWAHGRAAAANQLAAAAGLRQVRRLFQLRRSLFAPLDEVTLPAGVRLRVVDPESDLDTVLALNARSFTELPDQSSWTRTDFERRIAEPWFDPEGLLMAVADTGRPLGFHWTKVHDHGHGPNHDGAAAGHAHEPIGEVYVVAVDPAARGIGLGRGLTLAAMHHLRHRGLSTALLYVDADNKAAVSLYGSLGFASWDCDTLFRR